ncbi:hypothetical protein HPB49_024188 [Dermacentor silvarum]|uniref:Uncharacterized protein n=1 Tax=Dermacentor silvarum TaxID=543639 RepID=A0ACB8C631_DERSI|nr:hypothetical protein HPB49_024188 [Dermacentor silvarum]
MAYQVEGVSITSAELEADSRWIRGVKAHRAAAAHQAIASTPPASPPSKTPTPPPAITPSTTTLRRHAPLPRLPAEDFKNVFRPGGGLDLRTTTNRALLQILCTLATIDYATARTADRVRINPYNNSLTISTPSEPRARLYLRVSELRLGPTSYPLRAYMAAPDNALRGIIYNAVDSQTQDEIVQDLQAMNVNTPYAIADARQMGRNLSSSPSSAVQHSPVPSSSTARSTAATREPTSRARVRASSGSTGTARRHLRPPLSPSLPTSATHRAHPQDLSAFPPPLSLPWCPVCQPPPLRLLPASAQVRGVHRPHHHITATTPSQTPPQLAPAEEPMNTAPSAASSRASSPTRHPPHKRRSTSSDDVAPERDIVRKTTSFLEAFEQRVMARFVRLEERIASVDNRVATIESHLTALDARVAVLEARQSATEATLAHLSLPAPLHPAPTPTPSDSRLLHLWEAYHAVHRRWQAQKHNRRLRLRLARLASDMEEHCSSLLRQQWGQTCDRMAGNLGLRDTWSLLRVLLDPTHTKASQRKDISHLLHSSPLTDTDFLAALRDRYLCIDPPTTLPAYTEQACTFWQRQCCDGVCHVVAKETYPFERVEEEVRRPVCPSVDPKQRRLPHRSPRLQQYGSFAGLQPKASHAGTIT